MGELSPFSPACSSTFSPAGRPPSPRRSTSPPVQKDLPAGSPASPLGLAIGALGSSTLAFSASPSSPHWTASPAAVAGGHSPQERSRAGPHMWTLDDFEVGCKLGAGQFGHVHLVREKQSKAVAVLKVMQKRRIERLHVQRHIVHEINIQG